MLDLLSEKKTKDGKNLRIWRLITPCGSVPEWIKRYMSASIGYEVYRNALSDSSYWRLYYRNAFDGKGAIDHLYIAEVDNEPAARVWFGYSPRFGHGNFGNVFTEPEFRRHGLMNELLAPCLKDFFDSPAKMLCCNGNKLTVGSYLKSGFHLIYGDETYPLCILKSKGRLFSDVEAVAFDHSPICKIREGTIDDQYDCDKFMPFTSAMYRYPRNHRVGISAYITDYRIACQEYLSGNGVIGVAENHNGTVVGYAFALKLSGHNCLDFSVHPDNLKEAGCLLEFTAGKFKKYFSGEPIFAQIDARDMEKHSLLGHAGFRLCATIPNIFENQNILIFKI